MNDFWIPIEERIRYYLNGLDSHEYALSEFNRLKNKNEWTKIEVNHVSYDSLKNTFKHWYCKNIVHLPKIRNIRVLPMYKRYKDLHSLMNFFLPFDTGLLTEEVQYQYPLFYGEHGDTDGIPCIRKSRKATDKLSVIYNFRSLRLTTPCNYANQEDIPWEKKRNNVVWRGATTGKKQRVEFVKKHFNKYDVGFATTKQKPELKSYKKNKISIAEQLKYKYIISLEGNDVASNLRWVLSSNSVPIMPKPYWHSWIMEEKLTPNIHYLELNDDLSNLEEILDWAANNDKLCKDIALNGKKYMSQFLDSEYDIQVQALLLKEYSNRVKLIK
ncbi:glycosyl transferase family 90 [Reichenbachiella versicolor]|uniref:glycosyl transferase family 90 n=1 Tax=Reichenbachiella versicolor TaxID=1821036 RepID=UPI000D6E6B6C|nr:glycosyl transferase family 90 [Reichenbachiella versicolor]